MGFWVIEMKPYNETTLFGPDSEIQACDRMR